MSMMVDFLHILSLSRYFLKKGVAFPAELRFSSTPEVFEFFTHLHCLFNKEVLASDRFSVEPQQRFRVRFSQIKPPITVSTTTRMKSDRQTVNGHFNTRVVPQSVYCLLDNLYSVSHVMMGFKGKVNFTGNRICGSKAVNRFGE